MSARRRQFRYIVFENDVHVSEVTGKQIGWIGEIIRSKRKSMKSRKLTVIIVSLCMCVSVLSGCGSTAEKEQVQHAAETQTATAEPDTSLEDGEYTVNVELEGGSGRASVDSEAKVKVTDGQAYATIEIDYTLTFSFAKDVSFKDLKQTGQVKLSYADQFQIDEYGNYKLITIVDNGRFLLIPKGVPVPADVPEDVTVLQQPLNHVYLVSSAVMDLICQAGGLSHVAYTALKEDDWYVQQAKDAMADGSLVYAGKYSAPDYEQLLQGGCTFAIENTMITHNPEVKEKLEELGIRVMVERSSYEKHPLGRLEWIKLFGILFGKQQQADDYFNKQVKRVKPIMEKKSTGKKVAFFAVSSDGTITVRKPNDYVSAMIGLAGGIYSLGNYTDEEKNALSTMKMQMEDFYSAEIDADVLIYNGTIEGELTSIDELVKKNSLFADFQAVKSGQVYTTGSNFYQQSTGTCDFIEDLNQILTGEGDGTYRFLKKLQ